MPVESCVGRVIGWLGRGVLAWASAVGLAAVASAQVVVTTPTTESGTVTDPLGVEVVGTTYTITPTGRITGVVAGDGAVVIDNSGVIGTGIRNKAGTAATFDVTNNAGFIGFISFPSLSTEGGDDVMRITGDSFIQGFFGGGFGNDTLRLIGTVNGQQNLAAITSFETLIKESDDTFWQLFGNNATIADVTVAGGQLQFTAASLEADAVVNGGLLQIVNGTVIEGVVTVNNTGELEMDFSNITGDLVVNAGGIATSFRSATFGSALFGSVSNDVTVAGELRANNSGSPVPIGGTLDVQGGGQLTVAVNSNGSAGTVQVVGAATIAGGTTFEAAADFAVFGDTTTATVLSADGGVTGTFGTVSSGFSFLDASLAYVGNDVVLTLTRNGTGFSAPAVTANQIGVGRVWEVINEAGTLATADAQAVAGALAGLSDTDRPAAFDQLSGEALASAPRLGAAASRGFAQGLQRRSRLMNVTLAQDPAGRMPAPAFASVGNTFNDLALISAASLAQTGGRSLRQVEAFTPGFWADVIGGSGDIDGGSGSVGIDYDYAGLVGGVDFAVTNDWITGLALGYNRGSFDSDGLSSSGDTDSVYLGWYAAVTQNRWRFTGGMTYSFDDYDTSRNLVVGAINRNASADYSGNTFTLDLGAAYRYDLPHEAVLEPFGTFEYANSQTDSYTESGAGAANLTVDDQSFDALYTTLGARLYKQFISRTATWTPEVRAGWQHEWLDDDARIGASFATSGVSTPFDVIGVNPEDDAALLGAGLTADFNRRFSLRLDYNTRLASDATDHQFALALRIPW